MGKKFTKLNEFIDNSDYEVHTKRTINKKGVKTGKSIDWESTKADWKHEALTDCKNNKNDLYDTIQDCAKDTLREDHPEFCLGVGVLMKRFENQLIKILQKIQSQSSSMTFPMM